jgi:hypothetical protein
MAKAATAEIVKPESGTVGEELAQQVAQGNTIIRLENTTQMAVAVQRRRDNKAVLDEALEVLELSPTLVEAAIYSKPVGKDPQTGKQKYAEGLSVRAAEELRRIYGNNSAGTSVLEDRKDEIIIGAVFVDMEKNTRYAAEKAVSKFFKKSGTNQIVQIPPDRLQDVVVPAHASKLLREVVLRSLPAWLKSEFEAKARDLMLKGNLPKLRAGMVQKFGEMNVTEEMILKHLGRAALKDVTRDDIVTMRGVYNAIRDGEQTVEDVFGKAAPAAGQQQEKKAEQPNLVPQGPAADREPGQEG